MKIEDENIHIQRGNQELTTRRIRHKKRNVKDTHTAVCAGAEFLNIYGLFQLLAPPAHKSLMKSGVFGFIRE